MGKNCLVVQVDIPPAIQTGGWDDVSIQRYNPGLIEHSVRSAKAYAAHHGFDYKLYTDQKWPQYHPQVELFRPLFDVKYKHYDYMLILDVDVICNTKDNILDDCRMDRLNYVEPNPNEYNMFNSGVVVIGKHIYSHLLYHLNLERANMLLNTDQQELQILIDVVGFGHIIPNRWNNYMQMQDTNSFLHFKGGFKERFNENIHTNNV